MQKLNSSRHLVEVKKEIIKILHFDSQNKYLFWTVPYSTNFFFEVSYLESIGLNFQPKVLKFVRVMIF